MAVNMNIKNKRSIAFMLSIVIFLSILNFEYIRMNNSNTKINNDNLYGYYMAEDILNLAEEKTKTEFYNFQSQKYFRNIITSLKDKYIAIYSFLNIDKSIYTAVINKLFIIYNVSVFVVLYIHKKDGKIRFLSKE